MPRQAAWKPASLTSSQAPLILVQERVGDECSGPQLEDLLRPWSKVAPGLHGAPDWAPKSQLSLPGGHQTLTSNLPPSMLSQGDS